jgi:hypothetical protein
MGELSRLSELTRFLYVLPIIMTFRLHAKRVVPPCRDRGCSLPSQLALIAGTEIAHTSHVIAFCRVGSAKRAENHIYAYVNFDYMYK